MSLCFYLCFHVNEDNVCLRASLSTELLTNMFALHVVVEGDTVRNSAGALEAPYRGHIIKWRKQTSFVPLNTRSWCFNVHVVPWNRQHLYVRKIEFRIIYLYIYGFWFFFSFYNLFLHRYSYSTQGWICTLNSFSVPSPSLVPLRSVSGPVLADRLGFCDRWFCLVQSKTSLLSWEKPQIRSSSKPHTWSEVCVCIWGKRRE